MASHTGISNRGHTVVRYPAWSYYSRNGSTSFCVELHFIYWEFDKVVSTTNLKSLVLLPDTEQMLYHEATGTGKRKHDNLLSRKIVILKHWMWLVILLIKQRLRDHSMRGLLFPDTFPHTWVFPRAHVVLSVKYFPGFVMLKGLMIIDYRITNVCVILNTVIIERYKTHLKIISITLPRCWCDMY